VREEEALIVTVMTSVERIARVVTIQIRPPLIAAALVNGVRVV
jgi:hypothetical protein